MTDPAAKLREDRSLRQAARALIKSDVIYIKQGLEQRSIPARIGARLGSGARDISGEAAMLARENGAVLGAGAALGAVGIAAFLLRGRIKDLATALLNRAKTGDGSETPDAANGDLTNHDMSDH